MKKNPIKWIIIAVLLISAAALFAMEHHRKPRENKGRNHAAKAAPAHIPVYDSLLLKKFTKAIRSLDFNRPTCTYAGVIGMDDPNDTTNTAHHIDFLFCRDGEEYYYRLGTVEIIHRGELNVYVQHDQHKVVLSAQKIVIQPPVKDMAPMIKSLQSENYELRSTGKGSKQTLSLVNEHHFSCKELSVTIDTASGQLERIYSRLNDFGSPMDKGKDRVIDVRIQQISGRANRKLYPRAEDIVKGGNGKWSLRDKYATYELIML